MKIMLEAAKAAKTEIARLTTQQKNDALNAMTDALHEIFGARTDFEFITRSDMKKIISHSKKRFT